MKEETLNALKKSIVKWERIAKSTKELDKGIVNCALCNLFNAGGCGGCPVYEKTKKKYCRDTPYTEWSDHVIDDNYSFSYVGAGLRRKPGCRECLRLVRKELNFLKSLLPKENK